MYRLYIYIRAGRVHGLGLGLGLESSSPAGLGLDKFGLEPRVQDSTRTRTREVRTRTRQIRTRASSPEAGLEQGLESSPVKYCCFTIVKSKDWSVILHIRYISELFYLYFDHYCQSKSLIIT